jgi:hypothetical protein
MIVPAISPKIFAMPHPATGVAHGSTRASSNSGTERLKTLDRRRLEDNAAVLCAMLDAAHKYEWTSIQARQHHAVRVNAG